MRKGLIIGWVLPLMAGFSVLALGVGRASAEDKPKPAPAVDQDPSNWNVDAMIRQAGDNVSRRYNCNEEQRKLTHDTMKAGVEAFLRENQDEIWPLIRELWRYQAKGELPDPETAKRLAERILPLLDKGRESIRKANDFWRDNSGLSDQQKKLFDFDIKEMDKTFGEMKTNFQKWQKGEVVQQGIFPQPKKNPEEPPRPEQPAKGAGVIPNKPSAESLATITDKDALIGSFRAYVEKFIKDYQLDATQAEAAHSILREIEDRANTQMAALQKDKDAILAQKDQARKNAEWGRLRDFDKALEALHAPLVTLFDELKSRLETIPTEAQRQLYRAAVEASASQPSGPEAAATSQPAGASKKKPAPTSKPAAKVKPKVKSGDGNP